MQSKQIQAASAAAMQAMPLPKIAGYWSSTLQKSRMLQATAQALVDDKEFLDGVPEHVRKARESSLQRLLAATA